MSNEITPVNVQPSSVVVKENENNNGNGKDYTYVIQNSAPDRFEYVTKAKSGKKWCIGLLSLTPGLGYFANGQFGKALLTHLGMGVGGALAFGGGLIATSPKNRILGLATAIAGGVLAAGTYIASIVGSVKNADKNVEIIKRTVSNDGFVVESKVNK